MKNKQEYPSSEEIKDFFRYARFNRDRFRDWESRTRRAVVMAPPQRKGFGTFNPGESGYFSATNLQRMFTADQNVFERLYYQVPEPAFVKPMLEKLTKAFDNHAINALKMKKILTLNDVDTSTPEGQLLLGAIASYTNENTHCSPEDAIKEFQRRYDKSQDTRHPKDMHDLPSHNPGTFKGIRLANDGSDTIPKY